MNSLKEFQEIIGYKFTNEEYLRIALTHSSYAHENKNRKVKFNERLEFLGDSVLGLVVIILGIFIQLKDKKATD